MQTQTDEFEWEADTQDEDAERELRQESEERDRHGALLSDTQRARLPRLEEYYFSGSAGKTQTFWRLRYHGWQPGFVSILECLRRLHTLIDDDDSQIRYEARCDIEARLYQGKRIWW